MLEKFQIFLTNYNINYSFLYSWEVTSFSSETQKTTMVSKEDFLLMDVG
jgi:hypothetical protein